MPLRYSRCLRAFYIIHPTIALKTTLWFLSNTSFWEKVAAAIGDKIAESASGMGPEFIVWLLDKTDQDGWNKRQVYEELIKVNGAGKAALAHCEDSSVWDKVAAVVGSKIAETAVVMPFAFTEWVVQKTEEKGWKKKGVYQQLCKATKKHQTALSRPMPMPLWTKLSTWAPSLGLHFSVDNKELADALKTWHTTLADVGEENVKEAKLVRTLIEKKGVVVNFLGNGNDLESAVNNWNERNKELGE